MRTNTAIRKTETRYPATTECQDCDATFVGVQAAPAIRVQYPTSNPKRIRSVYTCPSCAARR